MASNWNLRSPDSLSWHDDANPLTIPSTAAAAETDQTDDTQSTSIIPNTSPAWTAAMDEEDHVDEEPLSDSMLATPSPNKRRSPPQPHSSIQPSQHGKQSNRTPLSTRSNAGGRAPSSNPGSPTSTTTNKQKLTPPLTPPRPPPSSPAVELNAFIEVQAMALENYLLSPPSSVDAVAASTPNSTFLQTLLNKRNHEISELLKASSDQIAAMSVYEAKEKEQEALLDSLRELLQQANAKIEEQEGEFQTKDSELRSKVGELQTKDKQITEYERKLREQESELVNLKYILSEKDTRLADLDAQVKKQAEERTRTNGIMTDLQQQVMALETALKLAEHDRIQTDDKLGQYQQQISQFEAQAKKEKEDRLEWTERSETYQQQITNLESKCQEQLGQLQQMAATIKEIERAYDEQLQQNHSSTITSPTSGDAISSPHHKRTGSGSLAPPSPSSWRQELKQVERFLKKVQKTNQSTKSKSVPEEQTVPLTITKTIDEGNPFAESDTTDDEKDPSHPDRRLNDLRKQNEHLQAEKFLLTRKVEELESQLSHQTNKPSALQISTTRSHSATISPTAVGDIRGTMTPFEADSSSSSEDESSDDEVIAKKVVSPKKSPKPLSTPFDQLLNTNPPTEPAPEKPANDLNPPTSSPMQQTLNDQSQQLHRLEQQIAQLESALSQARQSGYMQQLELEQRVQDERNRALQMEIEIEELGKRLAKEIAEEEEQRIANNDEFMATQLLKRKQPASQSALPPPPTTTTTGRLLISQIHKVHNIFSKEIQKYKDEIAYWKLETEKKRHQEEVEEKQRALPPLVIHSRPTSPTNQPNANSTRDDPAQVGKLRHEVQELGMEKLILQSQFLGLNELIQKKESTWVQERKELDQVINKLKQDRASVENELESKKEELQAWKLKMQLQEEQRRVSGGGGATTSSSKGPLNSFSPSAIVMDDDEPTGSPNNSHLQSLATIGAELEALDASNQSLRAELAAVIASRLQLETALRTAQEKATSLTEDLHQSLDTNERLEAEHRTIQLQLKEEQVKLQNHQREWQDERRGLLEQLTYLEQSLRTQQAIVEELRVRTRNMPTTEHQQRQQSVDWMDKDEVESIDSGDDHQYDGMLEGDLLPPSPSTGALVATRQRVASQRHAIRQRIARNEDGTESLDALDDQLPSATLPTAPNPLNYSSNHPLQGSPAPHTRSLSNSRTVSPFPASHKKKLSRVSPMRTPTSGRNTPLQPRPPSANSFLYAHADKQHQVLLLEKRIQELEEELRHLQIMFNSVSKEAKNAEETLRPQIAELLAQVSQCQSQHDLTHITATAAALDEHPHVRERVKQLETEFSEAIKIEMIHHTELRHSLEEKLRKTQETFKVERWELQTKLKQKEEELVQMQKQQHGSAALKGSNSTTTDSITTTYSAFEYTSAAAANRPNTFLKSSPLAAALMSAPTATGQEALRIQMEKEQQQLQPQSVPTMVTVQSTSSFQSPTPSAQPSIQAAPSIQPTTQFPTSSIQRFPNRPIPHLSRSVQQSHQIQPTPTPAAPAIQPTPSPQPSIQSSSSIPIHSTASIQPPPQQQPMQPVPSMPLSSSSQPMQPTPLVPSIQLNSEKAASVAPKDSPRSSASIMAPASNAALVAARSSAATDAAIATAVATASEAARAHFVPLIHALQQDKYLLEQTILEHVSSLNALERYTLQLEDRNIRLETLIKQHNLSLVNTEEEKEEAEKEVAHDVEEWPVKPPSPFIHNSPNRLGQPRTGAITPTIIHSTAPSTDANKPQLSYLQQTLLKLQQRQKSKVILVTPARSAHSVNKTPLSTTSSQFRPSPSTNGAATTPATFRNSFQLPRFTPINPVVGDSKILLSELESKSSHLDDDRAMALAKAQLNVHPSTKPVGSIYPAAAGPHPSTSVHPTPPSALSLVDSLDVDEDEVDAILKEEENELETDSSGRSTPTSEAHRFGTNGPSATSSFNVTQTRTSYEFHSSFTRSQPTTTNIYSNLPARVGPSSTLGSSSSSTNNLAKKRISFKETSTNTAF